MKKQQVQIGQLYAAKITNKVVPVRITAEHKDGGWVGVNTQTNREVRIKTAQKLRNKIAPAPGPGSKTDSTGKPASTSGGASGGAVKKKLTAAERRALLAKHKADQENARLRDEREASPEGMSASEQAMASSAGKKRAKQDATPQDKKLSLIDAAVQVLGDAKDPMNTKQMVETITERGLWSPRSGGKTPHATLYSAILREIQKKGADARFTKVGRGQFTLAPAPGMKKGA